MAKQPAPEAVALARRLYLEREKIADIVVRTGLHRVALYRCLAGDFPDGSAIAPVPIARRRRHRRAGNANRVALVERMWRTAERQVEAIEARLGASGLALTERESGARALAIVAKTLRELSTFRESANSRAKEPAIDDDDDAPKDIEELRRALADKLERFAADRSGAVPGDAE